MRVLLVRLSSLGDVVLASAAVEALRSARPDAEIHVLTKPAFREVFANNPGVTSQVDWDPGRGPGDLVRRVRAGRYDHVVDLHRNLRTLLLRLAARGPRWHGCRKGVVRRRVAVALRRPAVLPRDHVVDRYVAALGGLGVPPVRFLPRVYPGGGDRARAAALLEAAGWDGGSAPVGLAPGARWATKAWPADRWRELAGRVRAGGGFPVVLGGGGDAALGHDILAAGPGANLAGETSILETAAVLERCAVLVTNDSAPLHLATAVGTRVVALFGPTVRGFGFYPLGPGDVVVEQDLPCRPCSLHGDDRCPRGHPRCMVDVEVDEVGARMASLETPPGLDRS